MLYALCAIVFFCLQTLSNKEFSKRVPEGMPGMMRFNAVGLTVTALLCACLGGLAVPSPAMIAFACVAGAGFVVLLIFLVRAYATGPLGVTSLLVYSSMLIPVIVGWVAWGESVTAYKVAGIVCMLVLFALSSLGGRETRGGLKWFLFSMSALLLNGALSVQSKQFTRVEPQSSALVYCFWWFLAGAIICWIVLGVMRARGMSFAPWSGEVKKPLLLTAVGLGIGTAGGNACVMAGYFHMDASLLVPLVQGGVVLAMVFVSALVYHEKITRRSLVTIAFGLAGMALLSLS